MAAMHGQRDGQVVVAALLGQVGGRQVGDHPLATAGPGRARRRPPAPARGSRPTALSPRPTDDEVPPRRRRGLHLDSRPRRASTPSNATGDVRRATMTSAPPADPQSIPRAERRRQDTNTELAPQGRPTRVASARCVRATRRVGHRAARTSAGPAGRPEDIPRAGAGRIWVDLDRLGAGR